ncbi:Methyltransferase domain-containing protein [Chryseobacterium sp. OV279]|nr:N-6 DNA methylase [Chryseobacterium sp. OV279]SHF40658.1 Methyltransferase domain-containing protein [Chryseobacterium sp. OV279]
MSENRLVYNNDDISVIEGNKNELIVFNSSKDRHSFLELLKLNNQNNNRTLVALHSATNTKKFINRYQNYEGKIFLCLNGDRTGSMMTLKILTELNEKNIKDIRPLYGISESGNQSLSEYLENKLGLQNKNTILVEPKNSEDASLSNKRNGISNTQHVGSELSERNSGKPLQSSQSGQNGNHPGGQAMGSHHAGNGFEGTKWSDLGSGTRGRSTNGAQPQNDEDNEGRKHSVGGIVSGRALSNRTGSGLDLSHKNNEDVDILISKYRGQKLTSEQVAEVVSAACFVSGDHKISLKESFNPTDELKDICSQFKSGGTAKVGRGILDEYYTDSRIVDAVSNLIKDRFKNRQEISVLEPSVGTGNFLYAAKQLGIKTNLTALEINETTAKIAKILHPEADIHLRSFETEFIDEKGHKKEFSEKYHLVIGNPPYGDHRGLYKGLGEEPKISKYEDYFVKRSLDSLKPSGILAMVLPSGWLSRQSQLKNAELIEGFRLPSGAFAGTAIGTDIIILRKDPHKISTDISNYFEINPEKILGETRQKTNRFGRQENYVYGNLEEALLKIEQLRGKKETERIGNLFEDLFLEADEEPEIILKNKDSETQSERIIDSEPGEVNLTEVRGKVEQVLSFLNAVKFKSPAIVKEIEKYSKIQSQIDSEPKKFDQNRIEILQKAEKILQSQNEKNTEYRIQALPELKKGVLKYQFLKADDIVNTSLQNSAELSKEQIESFRDTEYDGWLHNSENHKPFANYIDGKWVHDFYYAEGNIYAKIEQLEKDFADKYSNGGTENQYEKQKALLESVLPKPKSLDEILIFQKVN